MTLQELYKTLRMVLSDADALYVLRKRTGADYADLIADPAREVDEKSALGDLARHRKGEPLSRIYAEREFWGLNFKLSPDTLDPRPDTETLVEAALAAFRVSPPARILDMGTGTGCILIALLREWPQSQGVGLDLSFDAVKTARENAQAHKVDARAGFICGSWGEALAAPFDLVVSNPPYIARQVLPGLSAEVREFDPILALDGGEDGLQAYKSIFSNLSYLLKKRGRAIFEMGFDQKKTLARLAEESGFCTEGVHRDLAGLERVLEISRGDK